VRRRNETNDAKNYTHALTRSSSSSQLWRELTTQRLGPARALAALEEMFSPGRKAKTTTCVVVVVDEIDVLLTRDQGVRIASALAQLPLP